MPGRHQLSTSRSKLRWLVGAGGAAVGAATLLALFPTTAGASGDPVKATFSVTGVSTSNCSVSAGGSDVYVKPGQELDVKSSVVGLTVGGVPIDLSQVASFSGALTIDPGKSDKQVIDITASYQKVAALTPGNHAFTWDINSLTLVGGLVKIPLTTANLTNQALAAGASLTYTGTIHVTDNAAQCGVSVQVPGVNVSASASGLPPVKVSVPGVTVPTVPVSVPSLPVNVPSLPNVGGNGGSSGNGASAPASSAGSTELPVPARVVPRGDGQAVYGNAGGFGGNAAGATVLGGSGGSAPLTKGGSSSTSAAAPVLQQDSTGKHKTIDLAASKASSTGQFSVILAIVAIIALSVVAATYARLYLLKREVGA